MWTVWNNGACRIQRIHFRFCHRWWQGLWQYTANAVLNGFRLRIHFRHVVWHMMWKIRAGSNASIFLESFATRLRFNALRGLFDWTQKSDGGKNLTGIWDFEEQCRLDLPWRAENLLIYSEIIQFTMKLFPSLWNFSEKNSFRVTYYSQKIDLKCLCGAVKAPQWNYFIKTKMPKSPLIKAFRQKIKDYGFVSKL